MGMFSHFVSNVVTIVENDTGNQGSGAGDWTEQQATNAENAAQTAIDATTDALKDPLGVAGGMILDIKSKTGEWITGGLSRSGIQGLPPFELRTLFQLAQDVVQVTTSRLEREGDHYLGTTTMDAGRLGYKVGKDLVTGGPAAAWQDVKSEIGRGSDLLGKVRRWGERTGARVNDAGTSAAPPVKELARRADDERRKLIQALQLACTEIGGRVRGGLSVRRAPTGKPMHSRGPEGDELRRLMQILEAAAESGSATINPKAARHLADATAAAARGTVLHAELLLWLASIRRVAARARKSKRR